MCLSRIFSATLLLVIASTLFQQTLHADCSGNGIWTWPNDSLALNGEIIITGYAFDQRLIRDIQLQNPRLVNPDHSIPLLVETVNVSTFSLSQAVLSPMEPLRAGLSYRLEIDSNHILYGRGGHLVRKDSSRFIWTAVDRYDVSRPEWTSPPTVTGASVVYFGCGPERNLTLSLGVNDVQPIALEVELTPEGRTGKTQRFIITTVTHDDETDHSTVQIGHGMCAGEFTMETNVRYVAQFTAIDASGNRTRYPNRCRVSLGVETNEGRSCLLCKATGSQEGCEPIPDENIPEDVEIRVR